MDYTPLLIIGAATIRSVAGWLENAISVKGRSGRKIDDFEWRELFATLIRVGVIGIVITYFPWINISGIESAAVAFGADYLLSALKKLRK